MSAPPLRWHVYPDVEALTRATVAAVAAQAEQAIAGRDKFTMVLAGGTTPRRVYAGLVELVTPWDRWELFFGDERCLPAGDPQRNDTMARQAWLDHVPIPRDQIHPIPAESGPDAGAEAYARRIVDVGVFDLTLLGLGEDGHTASLFPGHPWGAVPGSPDVLAVHGAPKPPPERISLSAARLSRSRAVFLLVRGTSKRAAVESLRDEGRLPVHALRVTGGIDILLDRAAAG